MADDVRAFGSAAPTRFAVIGPADADADLHSLTLYRTLWFDRDPVSGTWLVWAEAPHPGDPDSSTIGAIVVRDEVAAALIEALGQLVIDPGRFADEPHFDGSLRWEGKAGNVVPLRAPPMVTLLEDVPLPLLPQERTAKVDDEP